MPLRTRQQLLDDAAAALPSNQDGEITAGHVRGRVVDLAGSMVHKGESQASPINTYTANHTLDDTDRYPPAWVYVDSASARVITLSND